MTGSDRDAPDTMDSIRRTFDAVAEQYAAAFHDELDRKPADRQLLHDFATAIRPGGEVLDIGCGPAGQVGRFVHELGLPVTGVDISPRSVEVAAGLNPGMRFVVGDVRALPIPDMSIAGVLAFYCLIYGEDADVMAALREIARVLEPGGVLLAAVHGGTKPEHFDDFLGTPIDVTLHMTTPAVFATMAEAAGLEIEWLRARDPAGGELPTPRIYLSARSPRPAVRVAGA